MSTVTDEDLGALLAELASSYDVPAHGPAEVLSTLAAAPVPVPVVRRRWLQLSAAAALTVGFLVGAVALTDGGGGADMMSAGSATSDSAVKQLSDTARDSARSAPAQRVPESVNALVPAAGGSAATPGGSTASVGAPAPDAVESRVVKAGTIARRSLV